MKKPIFNIVKFLQTSDYSLFNFFEFNRKVDKNHVKTLMDSMKKRGFRGVILVIKTSIIDGVERYYILDGQHRFTAAKELGIAITFEVVDVNTELELAGFIADVNNSSKAWGTNQFLEVWSSMKIKEYIKLSEIQKETKIQITPLIEAYTGQGNMTTFRKGTLKFNNETASNRIIHQLMDLNESLPTKAFCRRAIIRVMRNENYKHSLVKPLIERYGRQVGFTENETELRGELETLVEKSIK